MFLFDLAVKSRCKIGDSVIDHFTESIVMSIGEKFSFISRKTRGCNGEGLNTNVSNKNRGQGYRMTLMFGQIFPMH